MPSNSILGLNSPPPNSRLSISSSPQPSMSSSESPMSTPTLDTNLSSLKDLHSSADENAPEIVPKVEELDVQLEDVKVAPDEPLSPNRLVKKRPRGRPRKHPITPPTAVAKPLKGRSKTGCLTCRRRKKKCDETKPHCLSCQKNNVHCEGYAPKEIWRSGKDRVAQARRYSFDTPLDLPPLMEGVENDMDRHLLEHFIDNASRVLTLHGDKENPFTTILLPMAFKHRGLMHSILCLSGSHLSSVKPDQMYQERQAYHYDRAVNSLRQGLAEGGAFSADSGDPQRIEDPIVAQTLILFLHCICNGDTSGEYVSHMEAAKHLVLTQQSPDPNFQGLLQEFFWYHYIAKSITSLDNRPVLMMEDFKLPFMVQPEAGALIGVIDGLFGFISKISHLRHKVRYRRDHGQQPHVDFECMADTHAIDMALRNWVCPQPRGTSRRIASLLYNQCTWVYLYRTTKPSRPDPIIKKAVDDGLIYLRELPDEDPTQSIILMPLFLLGCAAFDHEQRPEILQKFESLVKYSALRNIQCAKAIVEQVWEMMDAGNEESWDWETIIQKRGWNFLIT